MEIKQKIKSFILLHRELMIIAILIIALIIISILFIRSCQASHIQKKIDKTNKKLEQVNVDVENDKNALKNNVIEHGEFVKSTTDSIKAITKTVKPFKPLKYENSEIKSASYHHMRSVLDSAQPNP